MNALELQCQSLTMIFGKHQKCFQNSNHRRERVIRP